MRSREGILHQVNDRGLHPRREPCRAGQCQGFETFVDLLDTVSRNEATSSRSRGPGGQELAGKDFIPPLNGAEGISSRVRDAADGDPMKGLSPCNAAVLPLRGQDDIDGPVRFGRLRLQVQTTEEDERPPRIDQGFIGCLRPTSIFRIAEDGDDRRKTGNGQCDPIRANRSKPVRNLRAPARSFGVNAKMPGGGGAADLVSHI